MGIRQIHYFSNPSTQFNMLITLLGPLCTGTWSGSEHSIIHAFPQSNESFGQRQSQRSNVLEL
jgi:hypothetical protein